MIDEVAPNVFRIEVPLPNNPLRSINSYTIKGDDRNLVIDTAMNRDECEAVLSAGFEELGLDLGSTDFFITHFHADHMGLVSRFATDTSLVYYNEIEAAFLDKSGGPRNFLSKMSAAARLNGFPEDEISESVKKHPGNMYGPPQYPEFTILSEGDTLDVGDYTFECISTPGHTIGHMCLYDKNKKLLIAGDHVLGDITPNIAHEGGGGNPLADFLDNLDKVDALEVDLVLPGHRSVFTNFHERIQELKDHHQERAEEVLTILGGGEMTVYEITRRMRWKISAKSWADFPIMQKWFASGECNAHLIYLEQLGKVQRRVDGGVSYLSLNEPLLF